MMFGVFMSNKKISIVLGCVLATNVFAEVQGDLVLVAEPVEEAQEVQLDRSVQLEGTVVVEVDGDLVVSDMTGIDEFVGVAGKTNKLYLSEDVTLNHKVSFHNVTIVGDGGTRGYGEKHCIETKAGGAVHFGKDVTLHNCLIKNLKKQSPRG
jgi:hypothetical protein